MKKVSLPLLPFFLMLPLSKRLEKAITEMSRYDTLMNKKCSIVLIFYLLELPVDLHFNASKLKHLKKEIDKFKVLFGII